jgi:hypothetical protein
MPRTTTLYASTIQKANDLNDIRDYFEDLLCGLQNEADRLNIATTLWDTMMIGSENVSTDTSTFLEPRVETWITWSATVLAVYEEEE